MDELSSLGASRSTICTVWLISILSFTDLLSLLHIFCDICCNLGPLSSDMLNLSLHSQAVRCLCVTKMTSKSFSILVLVAAAASVFALVALHLHAEAKAKKGCSGGLPDHHGDGPAWLAAKLFSLANGSRSDSHNSLLGMAYRMHHGAPASGQSAPAAGDEHGATSKKPWWNYPLGGSMSLEQMREEGRRNPDSLLGVAYRMHHGAPGKAAAATGAADVQDDKGATAPERRDSTSNSKL